MALVLSWAIVNLESRKYASLLAESFFAISLRKFFEQVSLRKFLREKNGAIWNTLATQRAWDSLCGH